ncbi:MAG: 2-hydroxychromene-2-carboxylate isomerase [Nevskiales bacterium]
MSAEPIRFYFDYISHNAYLAWTQINKLAKVYERKVEPVPVLFAAFLNHYGHKGPAELPAKSRWMIRDVIRKAEQLNVPLRPPASHPFNPLLALRLSCIDMPAVDKRRMIDGLFRATWAESREVSNPQVLGAVLTNAGLDAQALLAEAAEESIKARLRSHNEAAIEAGVFGVPSMQVDGELFWGYDDLRYLEMFLSGRDPYDPARLGPWLQVRPSSQRPGGQS